MDLLSAIISTRARDDDDDDDDDDDGPGRPTDGAGAGAMASAPLASALRPRLGHVEGDENIRTLGPAAFNQPIGDWDVSKVFYTQDMLNTAVAFNQPIGAWDVAKAADMRWMFINAVAFNQDIGDWDVSKNGNMNSMFKNASAFSQDIDAWDASQVSDMGDAFVDSVQSCPDWACSFTTQEALAPGNKSECNIKKIIDWEAASFAPMEPLHRTLQI
ncbi:hypothetical protein JL721_12690 [Aureococcus anophagefferens]|nr:hypothetical protein JL721_12690 [Aureococcus anophagefferens]